MAHITNKLRGLVAAFVAVFAALALVPGVAFAASEAVSWTGSEMQTITVSGLKGDATISIYEIGTVTLDDDGSNQTTFNVTASTNNQGAAVKEYVKLEKPTAAQTEEMLASITDYGEPVVDSAQYDHETGQGTYVSTALPAGLYYVAITDATGDYTYQAMVAPVSPTSKDNGKSWVLVDPDMTAKVSSSDVEKTRVSETPVNLGDEVSFDVTFTLNQHMASHTVHDEMTGLEYKAGSMEVYVGKTEVSGTANYTGDSMENVYSVTPAADSHGFDITFQAAYLQGLTGDTPVTIRYTATVCKDAQVATDLSNKAYTDDNTEGSTVTIDLGKAGVYKYEKDNVKKPLEGAIFQVFESDGTTPVKTTAGDDVYVITGDDGFAWTDEDVCNKDGEHLTGQVILEDGYQVVFKEVKAPATYRLPSDGTNSFPFTVIDADADETTAAAVSIPNTPADGEHGVDLPETGGMGTVALTAAGVVLVAGAAAFIVRSRKQN